MHLPRRRLNLTVLLPVGSEPGRYELQVLKSVDAPLVTATGDAQLVNGTTELIIPINLTSLLAGNYLVGIRRPPWAWSYDPVEIK